MEYTPQQKQVIKLHNRNLLVAAAAGSGKTAVLVERIVQMIADEDSKIDVDRLLVVTFTNAAAAQMRERIAAAISKKIMEEPDNEHLKRQEVLLHNALITTIDSFCLFVLRNNFNDIDLEPDFRIADEGEIKLLQKEAMAETMEIFFEEASPDFHYLLEAFCPDGKEKALEEYIEKLYRFSQSYPFPKEWLASCTDNYKVNTVDEMQELPFMKQGMKHLRLMLEAMLSQYEEAIAISRMPSGPDAYIAQLSEEYEMLKRICACKDYVHMAKEIGNISFERITRANNCLLELKERVLNIRNEVKESLGKIQKKFFFDEPERMLADMEISGRLSKTLVALTLKFEEVFSQKKRMRKVVDFNDVEHFALQILLKNEDGRYVPTETAKEYSNHFHEILIDEYQDSNLVQEYLLWAVSGEPTGNDNRFMVGDVKQSIYKFRLARPEIFMEKYDTYSKEESRKQKIELSMNFRSRREVVDSVNTVFKRIMCKELGNIDYSEDAYLYYGASYSESSKDDDAYKTEYTIIETGKRSKDDGIEAEAMYIAKRIHEIVGRLPVTGKDGSTRMASYKDIAILLRATSGYEEIFKNVFEKENIPLYMPSKTGYFTAGEVQAVLNFLKVLNNPYQDIPLFGVMKSVFGDFSDNEIALLRQDKNIHLYTSLNEYAKTDDKCRQFIAFITRYREMAVYMPIHELLLTLFRETHYMEMLSAVPGGTQKRANVNMLLEKAIAYGATSYRGLFHFVRYIEQLVKYEVDYGEANVSDESADVVSMYTIHKSKGLEFPVCFLAGTGKKLNFQDDYKPVLMDIDMGISTKVIDVDNRVYTDSLYRNMMEIKGVLDVIGEELRLLYVAMTRAKEKLIITGAAYKVEEMLKEKSDCIDYLKLSGCKSYMDMLLLGMGEEDTIKLSVTSRQETETELMMGDISKQLIKERLGNIIDDKNNNHWLDQELYESLQERLTLQYPHTDLENLYTKTTVSELKMAAMETYMEEDEGITQFVFSEEEASEYIPSFIEEKEEVSGTKRGTAYHRVLELLNLDKADSVGAIVKQIDEMIERKEIDESYKTLVNWKKLFEFACSNLAGRMKLASHAKKLYLEQPFVMGIPADEVNKVFPKEEMLLIQGIIDVYFEENDALVLADYKTDRVDNEEELVKRYQAQLDYYAKALEQLTGKKVKEKIIYSLHLMKEISL